MRKKLTFLTQPYSGYYVNEQLTEDASLTHVGPQTLCGEYLRRFWHPICFSAELKDLPLRIKILGEDLVVFKDAGGEIGLLQLNCPHRGTSLEFGIISRGGIRCCYHGWLIGIDGTVKEMPAEPSSTTFAGRLCHGAYPTHEFGGLVFAYMGPPEKKPKFPMLDTFSMPCYRLVAEHRDVFPCNWLQVKENAMDPAHLAFLHTITGAQFTEEFGILPELEFQATDYGMIYIASRRVEDKIWVRIADIVLPNIHQFGSIWENGKEEKVFQPPLATNWCVPIDDTHCMNIGFSHLHESWNINSRPHFGQTNDRPYEERQRKPGDFDAQVGQGRIAIHSREHLTTSDRGIILFRKLLRQEIRDIRAGRDPKSLAVLGGDIIKTLAQDTVVRVPCSSRHEDDIRLMREIGRKVAGGHFGRRDQSLTSDVARLER